MNRRLLIQVTAPTVLIGLLLCGTCLASAWYINHLQTRLTVALKGNAASLQAAQELEISLRRLRLHSFLYLMEPTPERHRPIDEDHRDLERIFDRARRKAGSPEERALIQSIDDGYRQYLRELQRPPTPPRLQSATEFVAWIDAHPVSRLVEPCRELLHLNKDAMDLTVRESERVSRQAGLAMLLLGVVGPVGGLLSGYGIARGLKRSIARLHVRVQAVHSQLDQEEVGSVSVAADSDPGDLDEQLQRVVERVQEVGDRLQRQQQEMLRAEQLAAVGQLAAGVAHEVRNPLTSIKLLVESALKSYPRKPLTEEDLRVIHGEVVRLERKAQALLDFARPAASQRSTQDLRAAIRESVELVRTRVRQQQVREEVCLPDVPVPASIDRDQFGTVLVNLLLNALDAMPQGGRLQVELNAAPGGGASLSVADSGSGIPAEVAGRLFTPFASTKPTGTGLGLSICQRVVKAHGGRLTASNRPGGGACFTVMLPPPELFPPSPPQSGGRGDGGEGEKNALGEADAAPAGG